MNCSSVAGPISPGANCDRTQFNTSIGEDARQFPGLGLGPGEGEGLGTGGGGGAGLGGPNSCVPDHGPVLDEARSMARTRQKKWPSYGSSVLSSTEVSFVCSATLFTTIDCANV